MAGRGPQTFKKRQKEQHRKEKQQAKLEMKMQRKESGGPGAPLDDEFTIEQPDEADEREALLRLGLSE